MKLLRARKLLEISNWKGCTDLSTFLIFMISVMKWQFHYLSQPEQFWLNSLGLLCSELHEEIDHYHHDIMISILHNNTKTTSHIQVQMFHAFSLLN